MKTIKMGFMVPKREGYGEDSSPLYIEKENFYAVGVFDGMGGSGAATCKSDYGDNHTKAYVASRIIQEAMSNYIEKAERITVINPDELKKTVKERLEQEKSKYPTKSSGLRSKLVRDYPTTLAITTASQNEDGRYSINSYWAGDSRNYLWTADGFYQISKDDLDTELDPLENLRNDAALSNCICADKDFFIKNITIDIPGKFVILSATDGCFNYFATPMHFHEILLTGLKLANDQNEWENFCKDSFSEVTGDDFSISLVGIGFDDFQDLKDSFSQSTVIGVEDIENLQKDIHNLASKIETRKKELEILIQSKWSEYKKSYMRYLHAEKHSNGETTDNKENIHGSHLPLKEDDSEGFPETDPTQETHHNDDESKINASTSDFSLAAEGINFESEKTETKESISEAKPKDKKSKDETAHTHIPANTEFDSMHGDTNQTKQEAKTSVVTKEQQKDTPKFGRLAIDKKPSQKEISNTIKQFERNPSRHTAKPLISLIVVWGDYIRALIPQPIRMKIKKYID